MERVCEAWGKMLFCACLRGSVSPVYSGGGNRGGFEGDDLSEGGGIIRGTALERTRGSLRGRAV